MIRFWWPFYVKPREWGRQAQHGFMRHRLILLLLLLLQLTLPLLLLLHLALLLLLLLPSLLSSLLRV